jgi:hypothetical protein
LEESQWVSRLFKTFIFGIFLGVAGAGALAYSVPPVDLHREASHITVRANGGNNEIYRINLPRDRILVGIAGVENALPAGLEWPDEQLLGDLQAEMFKLRDRNNKVIGVASRLASASEATGSFIEWTLHIPARGTVYLQMELAPTAEGHRNGTLTAGTREFETLNGRIREQFISEVEDEEFDGIGRIELITSFVGVYNEEADGTAKAGAVQ